ncbi:MAG: hypothetical protein CMF48_06610 [Legionellales bacterium]|nr:hypothetical protein [Legionellales bacterium]|tara:strand:+ start:2037 stop:3998 length:1962 start_codon:yes stop_codon:yes gene_type:complete
MFKKDEEPKPFAEVGSHRLSVLPGKKGKPHRVVLQGQLGDSWIVQSGKTEAIFDPTKLEGLESLYATIQELYEGYSKQIKLSNERIQKINKKGPFSKRKHKDFLKQLKHTRDKYIAFQRELLQLSIYVADAAKQFPNTRVNYALDEKGKVTELKAMSGYSAVARAYSFPTFKTVFERLDRGENDLRADEPQAVYRRYALATRTVDAGQRSPSQRMVDSKDYPSLYRALFTKSRRKKMVSFDDDVIYLNKVNSAISTESGVPSLTLSTLEDDTELFVEFTDSGIHFSDNQLGKFLLENELDTEESVSELFYAISKLSSGGTAQAFRQKLCDFFISHIGDVDTNQQAILMSLFLKVTTREFVQLSKDNYIDVIKCNPEVALDKCLDHYKFVPEVRAESSNPNLDIILESRELSIYDNAELRAALTESCSSLLDSEPRDSSLYKKALQALKEIDSYKNRSVHFGNKDKLYRVYDRQMMPDRKKYIGRPTFYGWKASFKESTFGSKGRLFLDTIYESNFSVLGSPLKLFFNIKNDPSNPNPLSTFDGSERLEEYIHVAHAGKILSAEEFIEKLNAIRKTDSSPAIKRALKETKKYLKVMVRHLRSEIPKQERKVVTSMNESIKERIKRKASKILSKTLSTTASHKPQTLKERLFKKK